MESYSSDPVHQIKWQLPLLAMGILFLCVRLRAVSLAPHGIPYEPTGTPHLKAVVFTTWQACAAQDTSLLPRWHILTIEREREHKPAGARNCPKFGTRTVRVLTLVHHFFDPCFVFTIFTHENYTLGLSAN